MHGYPFFSDETSQPRHTILTGKFAGKGISCCIKIVSLPAFARRQMTNRIASEDIRVYILENNHPFTYKLVQLMKTARILFSASLLLVLSLANVPAADEAAVTPSPAPKAPKAKAVTEPREKKDSTESKEVKPEAPPTVPDAELGTVPQKIWQKPWPSDLKQVLANPSDRLIDR